MKTFLLICLLPLAAHAQITPVKLCWDVSTNTPSNAVFCVYHFTNGQTNKLTTTTNHYCTFILLPDQTITLAVSCSNIVETVSTNLTFTCPPAPFNLRIDR